MATDAWWASLSEGQRRLLIAAATAEASLKIAALIDIQRRPAEPDPRPEGAVASRHGGQSARPAVVFRDRPQAHCLTTLRPGGIPRSSAPIRAAG